MNRHAVSVAAGLAMVLVGVVLVAGFGDVRTAVIGLRQLGVVLVVLGVVEAAVSGYALARSGR